MPGGKRAGAGRKAVRIDLNELEKLYFMQCSDEEIAGWYGVSLRTIQNRRKQPKFAEVMRRGKARGAIGVRRAQMKLLEAGNASMAIWLGKTVLGQKDAMQIAGSSDEPARPDSKADLSRLSDEELLRLDETLRKLRGGKAL